MSTKRPANLLLCLLLVLAAQTTLAQSVRIGVLGLFRPKELALRPRAGSVLVLRAAGKSIVLDSSSGLAAARIRSAGGQLTVEVGDQAMRVSELYADGRDGNAADFVLAVSGKIKRDYRGTLDIKVAGGVLVPVITMDLELAVASVVRAESLPGTPLEALKAQAVATRSFLVAGKGRHFGFDFCDTTHCQFLREPPARDSPASIAAAETRGLVLAWQDSPFPAMFTRSCGGRTRTLEELSVPVHGYPYFSVECAYCRAHPSHWSSRLTQEDAAVLTGKHTEEGRLAVDRRLGWSAVPSNSFTMHLEGRDVVVEGTGHGHGVGLCQRGAVAMAQDGIGFRAILSHYYPNTQLVSCPSPK